MDAASMGLWKKEITDSYIAMGKQRHFVNIWKPYMESQGVEVIHEQGGIPFLYQCESRVHFYT